VPLTPDAPLVPKDRELVREAVSILCHVLSIDHFPGRLPKRGEEIHQVARHPTASMADLPHVPDPVDHAVVGEGDRVVGRRSGVLERGAELELCLSERTNLPDRGIDSEDARCPSYR
jgi:hypothetical protein